MGTGHTSRRGMDSTTMESRTAAQVRSLKLDRSQGPSSKPKGQCRATSHAAEQVLSFKEI